MGSIIEAFASEHAMVKVGTVIDPDMRDELHVTVVATGLGAKIEKPVKVIDNTVHTSMASAQVQQPAPARQEQPAVNYRDLDRPTVMRNRAQAGAAAAAKMNPQDDPITRTFRHSCVVRPIDGMYQGYEGDWCSAKAWSAIIASLC